jgi:hypothetical protein
LRFKAAVPAGHLRGACWTALWRGPPDALLHHTDRGC